MCPSTQSFHLALHQLVAGDFPMAAKAERAFRAARTGDVICASSFLSTYLQLCGIQ